MATAQELIEAALRKIQVKGAETPLTATELSDGLETLNNMAAELEIEGFELYTGGYSALALGDTVPIPDYALNFYKLQLGGRLATEYLEGNVPPTMIEQLQGARRIVVRALNRKAVGTTGTYRNIIYGAFEISGVKAGSEPVSTTELNNALPYLNDLMATFESEGFNLSYNISDGSNLDGEHGIPDWAWSWVKGSLALRLSSAYSIPPNEIAQLMAARGEAAAYSKYTSVPEVDYPETLPTGTNRGWESDFFGNTAYNDLQGQGGNDLLDEEDLPLENDS